MKGSKIYILVILLFLGLMFLLEYHSPKKFVWRPTYAQYDREPFGCAVFDDIVSASLADESVDTQPAYWVTDKTLYQLSLDSISRYSILIVSSNLYFTPIDREALLKILDRGGKVMLVSSTYDTYLEDTLKFQTYSDYFDFRSLKKYVSSSQIRNSLYWCKDSRYKDHREFRFYPHLCRSYFYKFASSFIPLVEGIEKVTDSLGNTKKKQHPYAMKRKFGKGEIILVSTPLLFTNYGMLDGDNSAYIFRLLTQLKGLPILRVEAYGPSKRMEKESPLRYLLSQRPLRWGLYLGMITIVLFMIFTARRQQRSIPIIRRPANKSVEFIELVGTLYYQKKDPTDLLRKKFVYFAEILRRTVQIDVEDEDDDDGLSRRIALKTGIPEKRIFRLLSGIRPVVRGEQQVGEVQMKNDMEEMNEIINHL